MVLVNQAMQLRAIDFAIFPLLEFYVQFVEFLVKFPAIGQATQLSQFLPNFFRIVFINPDLCEEDLDRIIDLMIKYGDIAKKKLKN